MTSNLIVIVGLLSSGPVLGKDTLPRPEAPAPVSGQCERNLPISKGRPLPHGLQLSSGAASCSAVAVPLSDYAVLLATEKWGESVSAQYRLDVAQLEQERDWYKVKLQEEQKLPPFLERPGTQRWFGRLETLVTVGVVSVGLGAAYQYGSGGLR